MTKSVKTSEFYVVLAMLVVWALRYLGIDLSPEVVQGDITALAKELHGLQGNTDSAGYLLGLAYLVSRTGLKWRNGGGQVEGGG